MSFSFGNLFGGAKSTDLLKGAIANAPSALGAAAQPQAPAGLDAGAAAPLPSGPAAAAQPAAQKLGILGRMKAGLQDDDTRRNLIQNGLAYLNSGLAYGQ